ncbi:hypothetical protein C882_1109 [Caenispirillum salinarum AK4]|uniref:Uncharacterized protein n=1 Tax=Caenispirillum salinarum AK4 TaxID=1238182 RepID=K9HC48_9PROT|nr:hypothetical protein [Caenispirillum salinarum]EKV28108.1 hypothetical protein C882_1109 [Caenispirillum salinarum AK4]
MTKSPNGTPLGFANPGSAEDKGPPAKVPTPRVYDFTGDKKPVIPDEDRPHLKKGGGDGHGSLPTPPVYDYNKKQA